MTNHPDTAVSEQIQEEGGLSFRQDMILVFQAELSPPRESQTTTERVHESRRNLHEDPETPEMREPAEVRKAPHNLVSPPMGLSNRASRIDPPRRPQRVLVEGAATADKVGNEDVDYRISKIKPAERVEVGSLPRQE